MSAAAAIGLRAMKGGAVAVAVALDQGEPRMLFSTILETHAAGDRLSLEPYAVAFELGRGGDAAAAVADGRARQDRLAAEALRTLVDQAAAGHAPITAALLVNRAGWVTDLLAYSLAFPDHIPVAEGLAVREALRVAARDGAIEMVELDETSLPLVAANALRLPTPGIDATLKALGTGRKPWRKEQKLAALAAWVALAQR